MQVLCLYGPRKSKPTVKNELRKQQYKTVTLSDCNHLAHVIVLWQIQKFMLLYRFCFLTLYLRAISKYKPPGDLFSEGRFNGGIFAFALRVWGAYTCMEGLIFGILRYLGGLRFFCITHHR